MINAILSLLGLGNGNGNGNNGNGNGNGGNGGSTNGILDVEVAAKLNSAPSADVVSMLGTDGRSYVLSYRTKLSNGSYSAWKSVEFIS